MMLMPTPFDPIPNQEQRIMKAYKSMKECRINARKMGPNASCKSTLSAPLTPALITPFLKIGLTPIRAGVKRAPFSKIFKILKFKISVIE